MPSPIAHSVTGYALTRLPFLKTKLTQAQKRHKISSRLSAVAPLLTVYGIFVSNIPDLDFLPQVITGLPFHRGPSHSLFVAVVISALLAWPVHKLQKQLGYKTIFGITLCLYGAHLFLDLFTTGGKGVPLLWPLSDVGFRAPFPLFPPVHHSRGLWDKSHIVFAIAELIYAIGLLTGLNRLKVKTRPKKVAN